MILNFNFHSIQTVLCNIVGQKNGNFNKNFTCLFDSFFQHFRDRNLNILLIGESDPNNISVLAEYFYRSNIHINLELINQFDLILIKSDSEFYYQNLNPGGILIVWKSANISIPIGLNQRQISTTHDESPEPQIFIWVIKNGSEIFPSPNRITIITPFSRPIEQIKKIFPSIPFSWIHKWIIVHDLKKSRSKFMYKLHPKMKEFFYKGNGISGNPQRNFALDLLKEDQNVSFIYFLDDDNIVHPLLWHIFPFLRNNTIFTFNQSGGFKGDTIRENYIDTAMFLLDFRSVSNERWILDKYSADGIYIEQCFKKNPSNWVYVDCDLCFYNAIS